MEEKVIKNPRGQNVGQEIHIEVEVSKDDERGWCGEKVDQELKFSVEVRESRNDQQHHGRRG